MAFTDRLLELLRGALGAPAATTALREAYGVNVDADEDEWRRITGDARRDLAPMTQARMQKVAHYLWEQNTLANRLIELPVAFLLAEGVRLECDDEENQKLLERFWSDPINDMDLKLPKKVRELGLFGEQCYPAFVNEHDGMVRIGYLDPALINTVVMDPDNPEQPIGIVTVKDRKDRARRYRVIINGEEEVFTKRTQAIRESFDDGECFYFRVNDLSSGSRGRSDLLAQADWLDAYDQFLFGEVERYGALRSYFWDVTLSNATEDQVKKRAKEISAPKPGSVRVHNDSEKWDEVTPDLKAQDTGQGARLIRNHVLGGATIPEHWFGGGGDVNRAVGAEMEAPTLKIYTMRQKVLKHMLESLGRYVLMKGADKAGTKIDWADPKWKVRAVMPELSEKDLSKQSAALAQVAAACASLVTQNLLSKKSALALIAIVAAKLGLEIDPEEELKAAEDEAKKAAEARAAADDMPDPPQTREERDAELAEACDLIRGFTERSAERFGELAALAQDAKQSGAEGARFAEALAAAMAEQSKNAERLIEALGKSVMRHELELVLRHGATEKTVKLPDGRELKLTEKPAADG